MKWLERSSDPTDVDRPELESVARALEDAARVAPPSPRLLAIRGSVLDELDSSSAGHVPLLRPLAILVVALLVAAMAIGAPAVGSYIDELMDGPPEILEPVEPIGPDADASATTDESGGFKRVRAMSPNDGAQSVATVPAPLPAVIVPDASSPTGPAPSSVEALPSPSPVPSASPEPSRLPITLPTPPLPIPTPPLLPSP